MSGVIAGRSVRSPRPERRRLAYALAAAVLVVLAGIVALADRGRGADGSPAVPASAPDDGDVERGPGDAAADDRAPAETLPLPAPGGLVPEVRQHIEGLRPRNLERADTLRSRLDAAADAGGQ